jgi:hypothetical protein
VGTERRYRVAGSPRTIRKANRRRGTRVKGERLAARHAPIFDVALARQRSHRSRSGWPRQSLMQFGRGGCVGPVETTPDNPEG